MGVVCARPNQYLLTFATTLHTTKQDPQFLHKFEFSNGKVGLKERKRTQTLVYSMDISVKNELSLQRSPQGKVYQWMAVLISRLFFACPT